MDDYYVPHYKVEILLSGAWHSVAWFVVLQDADLFCSWLTEQYPRETYRVAEL